MLKNPGGINLPSSLPIISPSNRSENKPKQHFTLQKTRFGSTYINAPSLPSPSLGCCFNKASQAIFDLAAVSRTFCASSDKSWRKQRRPSVGSLNVVRFGSILVLVIGGGDYIAPTRQYTWYGSGKQPAKYMLPTTLYKSLKNPLMIVLGRAIYYSQNPKPESTSILKEFP